MKLSKSQIEAVKILKNLVEFFGDEIDRNALSNILNLIEDNCSVCFWLTSNASGSVVFSCCWKCLHTHKDYFLPVKT